MAKRNVRIRAVRREKVDIDKLVSGLLLLLEELAADSQHGEQDDAPQSREADQ
jgi:hypothetical protein